MTTTQEQQLIDRAAKEYAEKWHADNPDEYKNPDASPRIDFTAGVAFALSSLLPGRMKEFAEWIRTFEALERQNGQWVIESQLSDDQIVKAFIEDIKQKEDARSGE